MSTAGLSTADSGAGSSVAESPALAATASGTGRPLAVVTGASSGIGYELARQFAEHGFDLIVVAESADIHQAARTLEDVRGDDHDAVPRVVAVEADLSTYSGVEQLVEVITNAGSPVDSVAINAGVGVGGEFSTDTELRDELRLINLNVSSAVHLAKRVLPDMVRRGHGRLLFTSSVAAKLPAPFQAVYGASKAFLLSFAEAIRNELKDTGVTVTALMPGPTDTNFFDRAGMQDTRVNTSKKDDPADVAKAGFKALMDGDDKVVASSLKSKATAVAGEILPEKVTAQMHRKLTEPGSGDN